MKRGMSQKLHMAIVDKPQEMGVSDDIVATAIEGTYPLPNQY